MAGVWPTRAQVSWKHGTGPKQGNRRVKEEKGNICDNWRNCGQWLVLYDVDSDRLVCLPVRFLLAHRSVMESFGRQLASTVSTEFKWRATRWPVGSR